MSIRRAGGVSGSGQTLHGGEGDDEVVHGRVHGCDAEGVGAGARRGVTGRRWWRWTEERTEETECAASAAAPKNGLDVSLPFWAPPCLTPTWLYVLGAYSINVVDAANLLCSLP